MTFDERLDCATRQAGGTTVLAVRGEIDIESAPRFREALVRVMQQGTPVHLDLSGVSFMDSSGLHVLLETTLGAHVPTGRVVLDKVSSPVRRVLRATGLEAALGAPSEPCPSAN